MLFGENLPVQVFPVHLVYFQTDAQAILIFLDAIKDDKQQLHLTKQDVQDNALYII